MKQVAAERGLILVDTKYELGKDAAGNIVLVDEIHTPDSSRYWIKVGYDTSLQKYYTVSVAGNHSNVYPPLTRFMLYCFAFSGILRCGTEERSTVVSYAIPKVPKRFCHVKTSFRGGRNTWGGLFEGTRARQKWWVQEGYNGWKDAFYSYTSRKLTKLFHWFCSCIIGEREWREEFNHLASTGFIRL